MRFFTKKAPERAFPGAHTGSGYIAMRPVRACGTPAPLLRRSRASASPPQGVTIPNAKAENEVYLLCRCCRLESGSKI